jgi:AdoMet-dependent heme synthase
MKMNYGKQIVGPAILDAWPKIKNRLVTRTQLGLLRWFQAISNASGLDRPLAAAARRFIGGYLYALKIEVNTACTLHCKMCYVRPTAPALPLSAIRSLLDQVRGYGVRVDILGGEPLLREDIVAIVEYAARTAHAPFVSLYTNGIHATPRLCDRLKEAGLSAAMVSLISCDAEVHDRFTGQSGSWERTIRAVGHFKRAGIRTYTFTAVHRDNIGDYRRTYAFAKEQLGVHALFYHYIPQAANDPLAVRPDEWREVKQWILMEKNADHARFVGAFYMLTGNACPGGNFVLTVKADGTVQPCPFVHDVGLGNIFDEDIWTMYKNRFRREGFLEFKAAPPQCGSCAYQSVCGGGCRAGNRLLCGTYLSKDRRCCGPFGGPLDKRLVAGRAPVFF